MALAKDKGEVWFKGGGILKLKEVGDAGAELTPAGTVQDMGLFQDGQIIGNMTGDEEVPDETGKTKVYLDGNFSVKFNCLLLQTSKLVIDFLRDNTAGKFYQAYWLMTEGYNINSKKQEVFMGICRVKQQFDVKSGVRKIPFEMTLLANETSLALTGLTSTYSSAADTATIGIGKFFEVTETAAA